MTDATDNRAAKPRIEWVLLPNPYERHPHYHAKKSRLGEDNRYHWYTRCGLFGDRMQMLRSVHAEAFATPCSRCYPEPDRNAIPSRMATKGRT